MAICVCVLKSEQKEEELSPMLFHSTYSTQSSRNLSQNKEEKNKTRTYGKRGDVHTLASKKVSLFTIRENGENCLRLFQTIWNISAASADYMLFFTWYFLHTHNKLVLCALHAGCVQQLKSVVALSPLPSLGSGLRIFFRIGSFVLF